MAVNMLIVAFCVVTLRHLVDGYQRSTENLVTTYNTTRRHREEECNRRKTITFAESVCFVPV
jgi:hypothetical protein